MRKRTSPYWTGVQSSATQAVMVPERRAVAKQGMQDVWHVVYSYTVDGEDYTVIGNEDFLDEKSAVAASNTGRSIEVKYLERDPEAATAQDFD